MRQNFNQNQFNYQQRQMTPEEYQRISQQQYNYMIYQSQIKTAKNNQKKELIKVGFALGATLILYLILQSIAVLSLKSLGLTEIYNNSPMVKYAFNIIAIHLFSMLIPFSLLALCFKKNFITPFFPAKKMKGKDIAAWISFGMGFCLVANIFVNFIIQISKDVFGYELSQNDYGTPNDWLTCLVIVVSTAIIPAICEEIAFRCCALGILKKYGKSFAVFTVSIVFGLIHGNVIQFVFAFFIGALLAFITVKTDNVIVAMCIHGFNNGMSVVNDIVKFAANEKTALIVSNLIFYIWGITGIISLVYLVKKRAFASQKPIAKNLADNNFFTKLLCLVPGLILPFIILIYMTSQYVTKV